MSFDFGNDPFTNMYGKYNTTQPKKPVKKSRSEERLEKTSIQKTKKSFFELPQVNINVKPQEWKLNTVTYQGKPYTPKGTQTSIYGDALEKIVDNNRFNDLKVNDAQTYDRLDNPKIYNQKYPNTKPTMSSNYNKPNVGKGGASKGAFKGLPTLAQMVDTKNYMNPGFYEQPRKRTLGDSGGYKIVNGKKVYEANPSKYDLYIGEQNAKKDGVSWNPIFVNPVSSKVQSERSRSAGDKLANTPFNAGLPAFSGKPNIPTIQLAPPKLDTRQPNKSLVSPYLTNYKQAPSLSKLSATMPASSIQNKFSQDIKLLSGGYSLDDTEARGAIANASASSAARLKIVNAKKLKEDLERMNSDPSMEEANRILELQGADYRFYVDTVRHRRGRYYAQVVKKYVGPTQYNTQTLATSRGASYNHTFVTEAGMNVIRPGTIDSVINDYYRGQAIVDFAKTNTKIQPSADVYDESLDGKSIMSNINSIINRGLSSKQINTGNVSIGGQLMTLVGTGKAARYVITKETVYGSGPIKYNIGNGVILNLSQSDVDEYNRLKTLAAKSGEAGKQAYIAQVQNYALQRKKELDPYIDPLDKDNPDGLFSYATFEDSDVADIKKYSDDLKKASNEYESNIFTLNQGITKVKQALGKQIERVDTQKLITNPLSALESRKQTLVEQKSKVGDVDFDSYISDIDKTANFLSSNAYELKLNDTVVAKRDQTGRIQVYDPVLFSNVGLTNTQKLIQDLQSKIVAVPAQRWETKVGSTSGGKSYATVVNQDEINAKTASNNAIQSQINELLKTTKTPTSFSLPNELMYNSNIDNTTNITKLEASLKSKEDVQKQLIDELKTIQKERIQENAVAKTAQIEELLRQRAISRRDAIKLKADIGKEVQTQHSAIEDVDGNVPIPDITEFDTDLRSEAQRIIDSTPNVVRETKKNTQLNNLRQVTRSRAPQASTVGSVLRLGQTVPRPTDALQTTLGVNLTSGPRNPFTK